MPPREAGARLSPARPVLLGVEGDRPLVAPTRPGPESTLKRFDLALREKFVDPSVPAREHPRPDRARPVTVGPQPST
jgi:hypothetical protein